MMASAMDGPDVLNLSRQHLKKVEPAQGNEHYSSLLLDHNEIARLENVETYSSLVKFSASHNQLLRMYGVARLYSLRVLNLSHNSIVSIEGLKDMKHLSHLNLGGNNIKNIEHLNGNVNLEVLDLSDNAISSIPDLSHMKNLKKLHLHNNRIKTLQFCEKFISSTVVYLTLADNYLTDLNEISRVAHLTGLENATIHSNPCCNISCDYRPYVLNWLPSLKIFDEALVNPKESLVAEWLYSQGKGRQFKMNQHDELVQYLASVRPEVHHVTNEENKLDKILNLARQHHSDFQQLVAPVPSQSPTPQRRVLVKKTASLRRQVKSSSGKILSKSGGCEDDLLLEPMPALMCQSLDSAAALERSVSASHVLVPRLPRPTSNVTKSDAVEECAVVVSSSASIRRTLSAASEKKPLYSRTTSVKSSSSSSNSSSTTIRTSTSSKLPVQLQVASHSPDASKLSRRTPGAPTPPSTGLMSPRITSRTHSSNNSNNSIGDPSKMSENEAAVTIQKVWRGYQTRNLDHHIQHIKNTIRQNRTEDHVLHLSNKNRCVDDVETVAELKLTCCCLQKQIDELNTSMQQVMDWIVVAQPVPRPRTLTLSGKAAPAMPSQTAPSEAQVAAFAQGMAHRLIESIAKDAESHSKL